MKIILACALFAVAALVCLYSNNLEAANATRAVATNRNPGTAEAPGLEREVQAKRRLDVQALTSRLPLSFEQNVGQMDSRANFAARGPGYDLFLTSTGAVLELRNAHPAMRDNARRRHMDVDSSRSLINLKLQGARAKVAHRRSDLSCRPLRRDLSGYKSHVLRQSTTTRIRLCCRGRGRSENDQAGFQLRCPARNLRRRRSRLTNGRR